MEPNIVFSPRHQNLQRGRYRLGGRVPFPWAAASLAVGPQRGGQVHLDEALVTVEPPNSGAIHVCGFDTVRQGREVRQRLGYLPQELPMYPSLSVRDFPPLHGGAEGRPGQNSGGASPSPVEMQDFARRKIGQLSGGHAAPGGHRPGPVGGAARPGSG